MTPIAEMERIPVGTLLLLTSGEYSSYCVGAIGRAVVELDPPVLVKQWLDENPPVSAHWRFDSEKFLAWLVVSGLVEELAATEWYLGDYGDIDHMCVHKLERL